MAICGKITIRQSSELMWDGPYDPKKHPPRKFEEEITETESIIFLKMTALPDDVARLFY